MKLNRLLAIIFLAIAITSYAQPQEITIDELKKYIVTMDSLETLKNNLTVSMNNLSKGNAKISSNRFNELMPIINNQEKLTVAKATADEIAYVKKAVSIRDEETKKFQQAYQNLIQNYLGQDTFTKVRNALKSKAAIKKKYDSLTAKPIQH